MSADDISNVLRTLAAAAHRGDRQALCSLLEHVKTIVRPVIANRVKDQAGRDAVENETLTRVLRILPKLADAEASPCGLLGQLAVWCVCDSYRQRKSQGLVRPMAEGYDPIDRSPSPHRRAAATEAMRMLRERLTDRQREIVDRLAGGETRAMIAQAFKVDPGTLTRWVQDIEKIAAEFFPDALSREKTDE